MKQIIYFIVMILLILPVLGAFDKMAYDDFESGSIDLNNWTENNGDPAPSQVQAQDGIWSAYADGTQVESLQSVIQTPFTAEGRTILSLWIWDDRAGNLDDGYQVTLDEAGGVPQYYLNTGHPTDNNWGYLNVVGGGWINTGLSSVAGCADVQQDWMQLKVLIDNEAGNVSIKFGTCATWTIQNHTMTEDFFKFEWNAHTITDGGYLDNVSMWNFTTYGEDAPPAVPPAVLKTTLELFNKQNKEISLSSINESGKFFITSNFTDNDISQSTGICNFTGTDISNHFSNHAGNVSLNTSSDTLNLTVTASKTNAQRDYIIFRVCRINTAVDLEISINSTPYRTIDRTQIPLCSIGFHEEQNSTDLFIGDEMFNISLSCPDCNNINKKLRIVAFDVDETISYDREYSTHVKKLFFNATTDLNENKTHRHLYRVGGSDVGNITVDCNGTASSNIFDIQTDLLSVKILSIDNVAFTNGTSVESSDNTTILIDIFGGIVEAIEFNVTFANGTFIKTSTNESMVLTSNDLTEDGVYNISISATDNLGNVTITSGKDWFMLNDTVNPSITWIFPVDSNTSSVTVDEVSQLTMTFSDLNLFAYEIFIKNPVGQVTDRINDTGLTTSVQNIATAFVPTLTGLWQVNVTVTDDHTARDIPDYIYNTFNDRDIQFNFTHYRGRERLNDSTIQIEYISGMPARSVELTKLRDRYKFKYRYFTTGQPDQVTQVYKVRCLDIQYRPDSSYIAHFVCPNGGGHWIDFETESLIRYTVRKSGRNAYNVRLVMPKNEYVEFSSIGGLNKVSEEATFSVVAALPTNTTVSMTVCPATIQGQMSLWIGFIVLAFFLVIGLMLRVGIITFAASAGMVFFGIYLWPCVWVAGVFCTGIGLIMMMWAAWTEWW